jgi:succinoglycan biosynthesis protein ExoM
MTPAPPHISVCICTYKRPGLLRHLLQELASQETDGRFTFSIVVVDNDHAESAGSVVSDFAASSAISVKYCVQPQQSIALTRNEAVENAAGEFIAFIDDDEFPTGKWLLTLFEACGHYHADGALGPVRPHFDVTPPEWVVRGKFYDRPSYPTGLVIDARKGRTGNTFLNRGIFVPGEPWFRPEFRTGEDQDFFRRMIAKGHVFVWCDEAVVFETVPPIRWKRSFMLRRALLRGATAVVHPTFGPRDLLKSLVAIPAYLAALPVALFLGQHRFMNLLVSLFDHLGKLLALVGIRPVKDQYITE